MHCLFYLVLVSITFLLANSSYLKRHRLHQLQSVLYLILLCLFLVGFVAFGWKIGLMSLLTVILLSVFTYRWSEVRTDGSLAALLDAPPGKHIGLPPKELRRIEAILGRELTPEAMAKELLEKNTPRQLAEEALFRYCLDKPEIQTILRENQLDDADIKEVYGTLIMAGAGKWSGGHWVAASTLADPVALRYTLKHFRPKTDNLEHLIALLLYFESGVPLPAE